MKKTPNFVGIGSMKSGTSWAWQQLKDHPQIGMPRKKGKIVKELHFFDRLDITFNQYLKKFGRLKTHKTGEFTPNYICCPYAPAMIKSLLPNVKLFTILRNPADRGFSHFKDHLFYNKLPRDISFMQAFYGDYPKKESSDYSIKSKGMYGDQLELWYKHFTKDQLKVMFYDDIVACPVKFLHELYTWIEVEPHHIPPKHQEKVVKRYNVAFDAMKVDEKDRSELVVFYQDQVKKMEEIVGRKLNWD